MTNQIGWTGWCVLFASLSNSNVSAFDLFGMQTYLGSSVTFAGRMYYEVSHDLLYITGQSGINQCFVGFSIHFGQWFLTKCVEIFSLSVSIYTRNIVLTIPPYSSIDYFTVCKP